jgi:hypothetical protein
VPDRLQNCLSRQCLLSADEVHVDKVRAIYENFEVTAKVGLMTMADGRI